MLIFCDMLSFFDDIWISQKAFLYGRKQAVKPN